MSDHPEEAAPARRHWLRWLLLTLLVLLLLPLVLLVGVLLALRSETGTEWVIEQVPGLTVESGRGSLLGQWQAESLNWQGYGVGLTIVMPDIDWSPSCLFEKALCLDRLHARSISLTLQPGDDSASEDPIELPDVSLPLTVGIADVRLGTFTLNGSKVWDQFALDARGSGPDWQLESVRYQRDEVDATLSGRLETRGDWPVDLSLDTTVPPPSGDHWALQVDLKGSVRQLRLEAGQSEGYLNASFRGRASPLAPDLPARLEISSEQFLPYDSLPDTLTLNQLRVVLDGSLSDGFGTDAQASLPGSEGPVAVALTGNLTTSGVDDLSLQLTSQAPDSGQAGQASIDGGLSWEDGFSTRADLSLKNFPWYSLIPGMEAPPVAVKSLQGHAVYENGRYHASLEARMNGPSGDARLVTELDGDLERLSLTDLEVSSGAGSLSGKADLGFAGPLSWDAKLQLQDFNPGYWQPALESSLTGSLLSNGQLNDEGLPALEVTSDLSGQWQGRDTALRLQADGEPGDWSLSELDLMVGNNRVTGSGTWTDELDGTFALAVPEPELFLEKLAGNLEGEVRVAGTPQEPRGAVNLKASDLAWDKLAEIGSVELQAELSEGFQVSADMTARSIAAGGQRLDQVALTLKGSQQDHRLTLNAANEEVDLSVALAGALGEQWRTWQGNLQEGAIELPGEEMTWTLSEPASLAWTEEQRLTFGAHCWRMDDASVCAGDQVLYPETTLAYIIRQFPTKALAPLMPEGLKWDARLDADLDLTMGSDGPSGTLSLDAGEGTFEVLALEGWRSFDYNRLSSSLDLQPERANLNLQAAGPELGELLLDLGIDPNSEDKTVDGEFRLTGLDIAMAGAFADIDEVAGQLDGQGRVQGPLLRPSVHGELALTGGEVQDPRIPMPLEDVVVTMELQGNNALLKGRWKSGDRSDGSLEGSIDWAEGFAGEVTLRGNRLPFRYEPYARLELAPELDIAFQDGDLSVQGQLGVPRGEIEVNELPPQAVSVSEDEVIVGVESEEPVIRKLDMNITVRVGEDRVTFTGFGLTGDLEGVLRIGNELDTRGSLKLVDGRYEAYGQELEMRRARLVFEGPLGEPYLDIEAVRRVDGIIAGIRLTGPLSSPRTEVFSEPGMPQSEALSYVILGRPLQSRGDEGQMSRAAISLGLNQTAGVTRGIGEELGIRNLTLEAEGSGEESAVVASGYITDELSLRYGVGIFEPITTMALRYDLGRYFYLEAASGLAASLDIFYTRDF